MEKFLLKHLGTVSFIFIIFILFIFILQYIQLPVWLCITYIFGVEEIINIITVKDTITFIGAIFAFWYGYKKYERDKELEMIELLGEQYDKINILNQKTKKLVNFWFKEYYYKENNYISDKWWLFISKKIDHNIINLNNINMELFSNELLGYKGNENNSNSIGKDFCIFIKNKIYKNIELINYFITTTEELNNKFIKQKKSSLAYIRKTTKLVQDFNEKDKKENLDNLDVLKNKMEETEKVININNNDLEYHYNVKENLEYIYKNIK